jgi:hypothetical protein
MSFSLSFANVLLSSKFHRSMGGLVTVLAVQSGVRLGAAELAASPAAPAPVVWKLDNLEKIGGQKLTLEGAPKVVRDASGMAALKFNGKDDGIIVPVNPLAGLKQFTIEILFSPDADGGEAQRFFHTADNEDRRALIELRLNKTGGWWLDTFLASDGNRLPLIDPAKVHRAGRWHWAALRYDGKRASHFVNGEKEREGEIALTPMSTGQTSLGVRLNRVYWFKGAIREVRFHPLALDAAALQRVRD